MAIRVRVLEKADGSFLVQRETADRSGVWQDDKSFTEAQEDRAFRRADRLFRRANGEGNGDVTVYQVG
jgi:hypothetical protein